MSKAKFSRPPLSDQEKEKKANDFINSIEEKTDHFESNISKKEPTKSIFLRAPQSFWKDIQEIISLTGLSMNAVCLELLRPAIKKKLKELKEE